MFVIYDLHFTLGLIAGIALLAIVNAFTSAFR